MKTIMKCEFGSHVYGTNIETSDRDYKGIFIPSAKDIILGRVKDTISQNTNNTNEKNSSDDIDIELFSLKRYLDLLAQGQTAALDMLFVPNNHLIETSDAWRVVQNNKDKLLHSGVNAFVGYCQAQASKYGIKGSRVASSKVITDFFERAASELGHLTRLEEFWDEIVEVAASNDHMHVTTAPMRGGDPKSTVRMLEVCSKKVQEHVTIKEAHAIYKRTYDEYGHRARLAEKSEGIDWKALCHAVRILNEAKELLEFHTITFPRPETDTLVKIRTGELSYKSVAAIIEEGMAELNILEAKSVLPQAPDFKWIETFVLNNYKRELENEFRSK